MLFRSRIILVQKYVNYGATTKFVNRGIIDINFKRGDKMGSYNAQLKPETHKMW